MPTGIGKRRVKKPTIKSTAKTALKRTTSSLKRAGAKIASSVKKTAKKAAKSFKASQARAGAANRRDDARVRRNRVMKLAKQASMKSKK